MYVCRTYLFLYSLWRVSCQQNMDITVNAKQRINEEQLTCKLYYHQFNITCVSAIIPGFCGKPTQPTAFKLVSPWLIIAYDVRTDQSRFDSKLY